MSALFSISFFQSRAFSKEIWLYKVISQTYLRCHIINYDHRLGAFVEDAGYTAKLFLASRVPYLELNDVFVVCSEHEVVELHSDGHVLAFVEVVLHEPEQD